MTIATDLGFKIGELYAAVNTTGVYYVEGTILRFTEDDGSECPWFDYVSGPTGSHLGVRGSWWQNRCSVLLTDLVPVENEIEIVEVDETTSPVVLNTKTLLAVYVKQHHPLDSTLIALVSAL